MKKLFAHIAIILSAMYIVFFHIDRVNPAMEFVNHPMTKVLVYALSVLSVLNAVCIIAADRKEKMKKYKKSAQKKMSSKAERG